MSGSKPTPGPWRTGGNEHEAASSVYAGPKPAYQAGRRLAMFYRPRERPESDQITDEDRANSRLAVAAVNSATEINPENPQAAAEAATQAYRALKLCLALLAEKARTCRDSDWSVIDQRAFEAASAAVAKAEAKREPA
jgi:hypothetical protein